MKILVMNCGSSSLKYQLIDMDNESVLAKGLCERIGIDGKFTYKPQVAGKSGKDAADVSMPTDYIGSSAYNILAIVMYVAICVYLVVHSMKQKAVRN